MLKGFYIDKSGMLAQQRRLDTVTNNLANINTIGFKRESVSFSEVLSAATGSASTDINDLPGSTTTEFRSGQLKATHNPLHVAIQGEGFFVINAEDGEYYTRNGSFRLNGEGLLSNAEGYAVATDGGELQVSGESVRITDTGAIVVDGQQVGRVRLVQVEAGTALERIANSHFAAPDGGVVDVSAEDVSLRSGYLELSNVDPVRELVVMIEVNRHYELGQKSIKTQDETLQKLINETAQF